MHPGQQDQDFFYLFGFFCPFDSLYFSLLLLSRVVQQQLIQGITFSIGVAFNGCNLKIITLAS